MEDFSQFRENLLHIFFEVGGLLFHTTVTYDILRNLLSILSNVTFSLSDNFVCCSLRCIYLLEDRVKDRVRDGGVRERERSCVWLVQSLKWLQ